MIVLQNIVENKLFSISTVLDIYACFGKREIVKLRQGSGKDRLGMAFKVKGLKA